MNKQIIIILLILIQFKAECCNSAFPININEQEQNISDNQRNYELAQIYYDEGKYLEALKKILFLVEQDFDDVLLEIKVNTLAGEIFKKTKDSRGIYQLEITTKNNRNNKRAIAFYRKALTLTENLNNSNLDFSSYSKELKENQAKIYLAISACYLHVKKTDSSKYYLNKLLSIEEINSNIELQKAKAYTNLGKVFFTERDFSQAEKLFLKSVDLNKTLKNDISVALALNNLASIYIIKEDFPKAKASFEEALDYIGDKETSKATERKEMIFDNLAWVFMEVRRLHRV